MNLMSALFILLKKAVYYWMQMMTLPLFQQSIPLITNSLKRSKKYLPV